MPAIRQNSETTSGGSRGQGPVGKVAAVAFEVATAIGGCE